jgi:hypothetical protein
MRFKPGDQAVYIKRSIPESGLVKDRIYTIIDIQRCGCSANLDIGLKHRYTSCQCPRCCETICYDQRWFINEEAFQPLITDSQLEEELKTIEQLV